MGFDQYERVLQELSSIASRFGISERHGTIYQVQTANGEQKYRVLLGWDPTGKPWLSPWLHGEDHQGAHRHNEKYHVGQNVKVTSVGGDHRNARVTPIGENQWHQIPNHWNDLAHTAQYDTLRDSQYPACHEHWLAEKSVPNPAGPQPPASQIVVNLDSNGSISGATGQESDDNGAILSVPRDDVSKSVVCVRSGERPTLVDMSAQQPWDGPAPEQNSQAQSKHLTWAKGNGQNGPPDSAPSVHVQYGDKTQGVYTDGQILHQINDGIVQALQSEAGGMVNMAGVLAGVSNMTSSILITARQIVHKLGNAALVVSPNNVSLMVGGNGGTIFPEMLAGLPGIIANAMGQILVPLNVPQSTIQAMAAAAMGTVAGLVTQGSSVVSTFMNVLALITSVLASLFGDLLTAAQQDTLATILATEVETDLGGTTVTVLDAVWASTGGGQTTFSTNLDLTSVLEAGSTVVIASVVSSPTAIFNGTWSVVSITPDAVIVAQPAAHSPGTYVSGGKMTTSGDQQSNAKVNAVTVPTLVAALIALIEATLPTNPAPLDTNEIALLAHTIVSDVIAQSAIMAQPDDMTVGYAMSDANMSALQTNVSSAIASTGNSAGIPSSVMSMLSSNVTNQVKAVSGGSVVSLLPQLLSYRGVNLLTGKSQRITKTSQQNFKINGAPVDVNG